ncbi:Zn-dependent protease with chaperone function [Nocardioides albertanoniae]|uniref:Zn-dependent protease with chaperone function n=1 Tax=Nocardioides albertanoniae TaxID=1175486 RepID=A0A543AAF6_9ACTN|nr:M48 family metallopeptidase [Nocardioides albertanoniae]TQL69587.1 Zn-dependent protease with chaperone function [Nocardioides albertanoniae]
MRTLRAALAVLLLAAVFVPAAMALLGRRVFTRGGDEPAKRFDGLLLTEQDQPGLWAEVRELASSTATRAPDEILLVPDVNAAVSEETQPFGLGSSTRRMFLGAPLLQGVSRNQLRAVLAHELGHHSTTHSRVGGIIHRGRLAVAEIAAGLTNPLLKRPFRTYARIFFALTRPLAHSHEIHADRLSAKVVGARTAAITLQTLPALDAAWRIYLEQYVEVGAPYGLRPTSLFDNFTRMMSDPGRLDQLSRLSAELPETNASAYDSHPPLRERVDRLEAMAHAESAAGDIFHADSSGNATNILRYPSQRFLALEDQMFAGSGLTPAPMAEIVTLAGARSAAQNSETLLGTMRQNQIAPATLRGALDLIASGNVGTLLDLVDGGGEGVAARQSVIIRLLASTIAHELVSEGRARYELSWSGPARLVDATGQALDPDELAHDAVGSPGYAAALRAWMLQLDTAVDDDPSAQPADEVQTRAPGGYLGALAPVSGDGVRTLLATDAGLILLKPSSSDRLATGVASMTAGSSGKKLIHRALARPPAELASSPNATFLAWDQIRAVHLKQGSSHRSADITTATGHGWSLHWTQSAESEGDLWPVIDHHLGRRFTLD